MAIQVFNTPADFNSTPLTIPANYLLQLNDVYGNEITHRNVSRPSDTVATSFADKFADTTAFAYPLTAILTLDPNAQTPAPTDNQC